MKKLLCLLLALCLTLSTFAGCQLEEGEPTPTPVPTPTQSTQLEPESPYNKHLAYTMTDADVEKFSTDLLALEQLYLQDASIEEIDKAEDALEDLTEYINDQCSIAQVIYCYDTTDEIASDRFLKSQEIGNKVVDEFMLCARRIYESDAPNKDYFFTDWTDAEMEKLMHYTSRVAELEQRNAELLVSYRDMEDPATDPRMVPIYREFVQNNNEIAAIYGYNSFYEYAYRVGYDRDYEPATVDKMHRYAKIYLVPACTKALNTFVENYQGLTSVQQLKLSNLLTADYDASGVNYVEKYLLTLPETARNAMNRMFEEDRVVFTDEKNAREGAFTTLVQMEPFCFFGPGYQSASTVVHELGHFYGAAEGDMQEMPLDLAETQSQGNEWLFLAFLEDELTEGVYTAYVSYKIYEVIAGTLVQLAVDAFEKAVYSQEDIESLTQDDFEELMAQVAQPYGGIDFYNEYITDLQRYWKMVVVESPAYYVSYAVSSMAAMNLFPIARENAVEAMDIYCGLVELEDYDDGFQTIIAEAGLPGPFQEDVYEYIYEMFP